MLVMIIKKIKTTLSFKGRVHGDILLLKHCVWCSPLADGAASPLLSPPPGSLLLDSLKEHISTTAQDHCKAIYLHVLTTNNTAIHFYENRDFRQHHYLPYYYSIRGVLKDGFTYVLYINGGHPPWTILYPFMKALVQQIFYLLKVLN